MPKLTDTQLASHPDPGCLTVAAITRVYMLGYVAEMLGEDEDRLHDLCILNNLAEADGGLPRCHFIGQMCRAHPHT